MMRGCCSSCGRSMPVRLDGGIKIHGPIPNRCPGSGLPPSSPSCSSSAPSESCDLEAAPPNGGVINPGRSFGKTLKRIPRASREQVARKFADV